VSTADASAAIIAFQQAHAAHLLEFIGLVKLPLQDLVAPLVWDPYALGV